jgi:hypothetical protein
VKETVTVLQNVLVARLENYHDYLKFNIRLEKWERFYGLQGKIRLLNYAKQASSWMKIRSGQYFLESLNY